MLRFLRLCVMGVFAYQVAKCIRMPAKTDSRPVRIPIKTDSQSVSIPVCVVPLNLARLYHAPYSTN